MERTVALGLLIAGIMPISLANSTVIRTNNRKPIFDSVHLTKSADLNPSCRQPSFFTSCLSKTLVESVNQPKFWSQGVTDSWLLHTPFLDCGQQSTAKANSIDQLSGFQQNQVRFSQSTQSIANLGSVVPRLEKTGLAADRIPRSLKTESILPSLSKLTNQKCIFSWQQQLEQKIISSESNNLGSNHARKPQHSTSSPKFPKLSRSSLIVPFPLENSSFVPSTSKLANPAPETKRIASGFGWRRRPYSNQLQFHQGIDYGAPYGSSVVAVGSGIVTEVVSGCVDFGSFFCGGQLGNWIEIDHGNGVIGTYGHLKSNSITVEAGMKVGKNQRIAQVGSSGWSTGAHLDFRLKVNGKHEDPAEYVMEFNRE